MADIHTHNFNFSWDNGGTALRQAVSVSGDGEIDESPSVAHNTTNVVVNCTATTASMKSIFILSDKDVKMSLNDQFSGSPDQSIDLKANAPLIWISGKTPTANPITADITSLHFKNAGSTAGDDAIVKIRFCLDVTP